MGKHNPAASCDKLVFLRGVLPTPLHLADLIPTMSRTSDLLDTGSRMPSPLHDSSATTGALSSTKLAEPKPLGSVSLHHGIRIAVQPRYIPEESAPTSRQWIFAYKIRILNESDKTVQLLSRRWKIVDSTGHSEEVRGEGVIGQQPTLAPGQSFEYSSFCPLKTSWGTMEGTYRFRDQDGNDFLTPITRFYLASAGGPEV
jgi:ApaG protein